MTIQKLSELIRNRLMSHWFTCRITSGRKSALYGIRFSYPLYIFIVALGILLINPYILSVAATIAFFGYILPMHPFDYLYNFGVSKLIRTSQIPGRGSELHVNSTVALLFNIIVIALILYGIQISYEVLALIYVVSSIFFIARELF